MNRVAAGVRRLTVSPDRKLESPYAGCYGGFAGNIQLKPDLVFSRDGCSDTRVPDVMQEREEVIDRIETFLAQIGLAIRQETIQGATVLPGITVDQGTIIYDPQKLKYPGDLLHEAGHLAVKVPEQRGAASAEMGSDPAEEMLAIAWSYAAALHIGLSPEVVFHPDGYRGGSHSIMENFSEGRFLAVPLLQWFGMACDATAAAQRGVPPYPHMIRWLREN